MFWSFTVTWWSVDLKLFLIGVQFKLIILEHGMVSVYAFLWSLSGDWFEVNLDSKIRVHFLKDFSHLMKNARKFGFNFLFIPEIPEAQLWCQMQNFVAISALEFGWVQNKIFIQFGNRMETSSVTVFPSRCNFDGYFILLSSKFIWRDCHKIVHLTLYYEIDSDVSAKTRIIATQNFHQIWIVTEYWAVFCRLRWGNQD